MNILPVPSLCFTLSLTLTLTLSHTPFSLRKIMIMQTWIQLIGVSLALHRESDLEVKPRDGKGTSISSLGFSVPEPLVPSVPPLSTCERRHRPKPRFGT
jgi:hypothetical protein